MSWLDKPEQWTALGQRLRAIGEFALDTETHGQPDRTSPQHRAVVHCWSVAVSTTRRHPRGYAIATGFVLPAAALENEELLGALRDPSVLKWAHNAPHDYHALRNRGVEVNGLEDTLQYLRVAVPGMSQYGLKPASMWALGKPPRPGFSDVTGYTAIVKRSTFRKDRQCVCGKKPCRAKGTSDFFDPKLGWWRLHEREEVRIETVHEREEAARYEVTDFVPGAQLLPMVWGGETFERMAAWEAYSLADALDGMELVSWLRSRPVRIVPTPWSDA